MRQSDAAELFWSVAPMLLLAIAVAWLIMVAPSIDEILRNY